MRPMELGIGMDGKEFRLQNVLMHRAILISLFVLGANFLVAQQSQTVSPESKTIGPPVGTRRSDPATVATAIRDSYYHPDGMSGVNCSISVDWPAFFRAMKQNPTEGRLKAIQNLSIRSQAVRGKSPNITLEWGSGAFDNKEQLEDGLKQILGGFYQMYWSMVASSPIADAAEITKVEPLPDGGAKVYSSSQDVNVVITVDKEDIPTHYTFDTPAVNGTIDLHYVPSPKPVPGDLRRIASMDVSEHIGTSAINVKLALDYQEVGGFYIPGHVSYDLGGAYSLSMKFSGCAAPKGAIADKAK